MAQQNTGGEGTGSHRTIDDDLRMSDAGQERVVYMKVKLQKQLQRLHQQTGWMLTKLENDSLNEREATEQFSQIEETAESLSSAGDALAVSARDRDTHLNDAVDRGLERASDPKTPVTENLIP